MKRELTWGEINSQCFLGDKRGWRYNGRHKNVYIQNKEMCTAKMN